MKILVVTHEYPPLGGGGANACMNLSKEFSKMGYEVIIITAGWQGFPEEETEDGVKILRLPSRRKHEGYCSLFEMFSFLYLALKKADKLAKVECFDVCQLFFAVPSGPVGYYLKKRYRIPYIIRFGGGDIPGFQVRFKYVYKIIWPLEKVLWKNAGALVANSQGLRNMAAAFFKKDRIKIIPNGVNTQMFFCRKEPDSNNASVIRLLFVSRLIERKGLQFVLPLVRDIEMQIGKKVFFTIVGDGPYKSVLKNLVREYGLEDCVEFVGQKEKQELPAYYQEADVFVFPSQKEGMPNVILEAMSSGLPILMTPCEGSTELIDGNGYAVPVEQFPEKLVLLSKEDSLRKQMGKKSREIVEQSFQWEIVAEGYKQIFDRVCR